MISLEKIRLWGDAITFFKSLEDCHRENGYGIYSQSTQSTGDVIKCSRYRTPDFSWILGGRGIFVFSWILGGRDFVRAVQQGNHLHQETLERMPDNHLSAILQLGLLHWAGHWTQWHYRPLPIPLFNGSMKPQVKSVVYDCHPQPQFAIRAHGMTWPLDKILFL